jgi:hypothetical protein
MKTPYNQSGGNCGVGKSDLMREHRISCMETNRQLTLEMWLDREYPRPLRKEIP